MNLATYLQLPFAQHALLAGVLVALISGVIGPFVISRKMAFAVHGCAELSFTGAAAGLLAVGDPVPGALVGSLVVAAAIAVLGEREADRDSSIGVLLAFGLGVGVLLLSFYRGFASQATNILFGQVFGISSAQLVVLSAIAVGVLTVMAVIYRPLLFASLDADVARARGVPTRALGLVFLLVLAVTVTEAAQIVGTLLVLSLAITPAAAARRLVTHPLAVTGVSVAAALVASVGGLLASLVVESVKASVFITAISFALYVAARLSGPALRRRRGGRRGAPPDGTPRDGASSDGVPYSATPSSASTTSRTSAPPLPEG